MTTTNKNDYPNRFLRKMKELEDLHLSDDVISAESSWKPGMENRDIYQYMIKMDMLRAWLSKRHKEGLQASWFILCESTIISTQDFEKVD